MGKTRQQNGLWHEIKLFFAEFSGFSELLYEPGRQHFNQGSL
jgi:hypothetical protein